MPTAVDHPRMTGGVVPRVLGRAALAVCAAAATLTAFARTPAEESNAKSLLRSLGFSSTDIAAIDRGQPIARIIDTDKRQIAVIGAVRINAPRERLVERYRSVDFLKRSAIVVDVGTFSVPPRADDLRSAPFEEYDLDVRDCRPGDCRVRLSADDIAQFQRSVNWRAPDWKSQSAAVWRDVLAGYAAAYASSGPAALPVYANKREALSVREEFAILLDASRFVSVCAPEFYAYLQDSSARRLENAEEVTYWSKEDFGVRPVFRISHQTIYSPRSSGFSPILIATTQLYADHYLDAALGLTLALHSSHATPESGFYMVAVNRARTRSLTGFLRAMMRSTVQGRSRDAMQKILIATKLNLEQWKEEKRK